MRRKNNEQGVIDTIYEWYSVWSRKKRKNKTKLEIKIPEKMDKTVWNLNFILPTLPR